MRRPRVLARAVRTACLRAFYDARRAGVSADRLAQDMSPDTMRGEEGPGREPAVYGPLRGNTGQQRPGGRRLRLSRPRPRPRAAHSARCEECVKGCAWLRHYGEFPRIMTREIYNNVGGIIMGDHMMNGAINSCALCGQCPSPARTATTWPRSAFPRGAGTWSPPAR